ncbi:hypothetical protein [Rhodococcus pyridinivorans]|uniref:hypothetical protein n=1 Tax=Rhodococcus pyridinivorans TaxID=103816 RepID=UPI001906AE3D|nr:hypothetical protein [Rhodococcus pyridinivorans]QQM51714.1 hypothetical protein JGU70_14090 [Rhodococcus pyridinivorans]
MFSLAVEISTIHAKEWSQPISGRIQIRDTTADAGCSSYPGRQFGWSIADEDQHVDGSSTLGRSGSISPQSQICETIQEYQGLDRECRAGFRLKDAVDLAIVGELAHSAGFDILISESPVSACSFLPVHGRVVVLSRADAVPVIAHYLRRQYIFHFDPLCNGSYSRHDFYTQSVHTLAPTIHEWGVRASLASDEVATDMHARYKTLTTRLARALETRDDILWNLGSYPKKSAREDCEDDFDHLLLLLCGAVDVTAGMLHLALGLNKNEIRNEAKLHSSESKWFTRNVLSRYRSIGTERKALSELARVQKQLQVVFELRNSIHNVRIGAVPTQLADLAAGILSPRPKDKTHLSALINRDMLDRIRGFSVGIESEWGFKEVPSYGAVADLWLLADKAVGVTFEFLNLLSAIIFRNSLPSSESAVLSGPSPERLQGEVLDAFNDSLPLLLGIPESEVVAPSEGGIPYADESWWVSHVRSSLRVLQKGDSDNAAILVSDDEIREVLDSERARTNVQWPDASCIAQVVYSECTAGQRLMRTDEGGHP